MTARKLERAEAEEIWREMNRNIGKIELDTPASVAIPLIGMRQRREEAFAIYLLEWTGGVKPEGASVADLMITSVSDTGIVFTGTVTPIGTAEWLPFEGTRHRMLVYLYEEFADTDDEE